MLFVICYLISFDVNKTELDFLLYIYKLFVHIPKLNISLKKELHIEHSIENYYKC